MQQITSLETLKQIKTTEVVELPSFGDGTPFIAEVKRVNIMNLISSKQIPNTLLNSAMKLFKGGVCGVATEAMEDAKTLTELSGLMNLIAEKTLVNPSCEMLKEAKVELSEDQLVEIMNYMQGGVKALKSFRDKQKHNEDNKSIN